MDRFSQLHQWFQKNKTKIIQDYFTFLRFESIASDPSYRKQTHACATWLQEYLQKMHLHVEKWETPKAPIIFASRIQDPQQKTLLLYGHYDVQPVDPEEEWISPPFDPQIREETVYARGAVDNKGQCFYTIMAIKAFLEICGHLPLNIKVLIDGEEESGSAGLMALCKEKQQELQADYLTIVDMGLEEKDQPVITLGVRGIVCLTLTLTEAQCDLHSGVHGGIAYNPNRALIELLSQLYDPTGRIAIPGFYDHISMPSAKEEKEICFDFPLKKFHSFFGYTPSEEHSSYHNSWLQPTVEINGISGGYAGQGFKTVIPKAATAKISCRLVPGQDPHRITSLFKKFLLDRVSKRVKCTIDVHPGLSRGFRTKLDSEIVQVMSQAYSDVYKKPCKKILSGGSIPIIADLAEFSQGEAVLVGTGLPTDLCHAPNEHFNLDRFEKGFLTICRAFQLLEKKS